MVVPLSSLLSLITMLLKKEILSKFLLIISKKALCKFFSFDVHASATIESNALLINDLFSNTAYTFSSIVRPPAQKINIDLNNVFAILKNIILIKYQCFILYKKYNVRIIV